MGFFWIRWIPIAREDRAAGINLVKRLRESFPESMIVANCGFDLVPELADTINGVLVESVFGTFDFAAEIYRPVPLADTEILRDQLKRIEALGLEAWVLDYAAPGEAETAFAIAARIQAEGWRAFVSTPDLRGAALAPWRQIPRRVFSLYGNLATEAIAVPHVRDSSCPWRSCSGAF